MIEGGGGAGLYSSVSGKGQAVGICDGDFLTNSGTISFRRSVLLHRVNVNLWTAGFLGRYGDLD